MTKEDDRKRVAACTCGQVTFAVTGAPIMTVACYCTSCQKAGAILEQRNGAPALLDADGGTHFVMCRKDRLACLTGQSDLREHRLTSDASTRRVVATCCNTPMFLEFESGHWMSMYKDRFAPADQPALDMRTMTADRRVGVVFADDIPSPKKHTAAFMWRLMKAWGAMGFKAPKVDYVQGSLSD